MRGKKRARGREMEWAENERSGESFSYSGDLQRLYLFHFLGGGRGTGTGGGG